MKEKAKYILFCIAIIVFVVGMVLINNFLESAQTNPQTSKTEDASDFEDKSGENQTDSNEKASNDIIEVTSKTFEEEVLKSDKKVLVDFYADWCGPCHMIHPTLEEIAEENPDIKVVQINVDNEYKLSMEYGAMSIPLLVVIEDGEEIDRVVGAVDKEYILDMLK